MDANKMHTEKARWELHKNVTYCFEQILGVTLHKTIVVWPPVFHLTNHIYAVLYWRSKDELVINFSYTWTC